VQTLRAALIKLNSQPLETLPDCPDMFHVYRDLLEHPAVRRRPGGWEYKGKFYPDYLTVGGACHAIFREALKYCKGAGVDVGAGLWPLPSAVPVDVWRGPGAHRTIADIPEGSLDFVFSSHCLEHNEDWKSVLKEWLVRLKPGGTVFLYLPHPDCGIWEVGSPFVGDGHKWTPTPQTIKAFLGAQNCEIVACDDGPDAMYSFWVCARREA
jgi:SAM-dependent methyltransferase